MNQSRMKRVGRKFTKITVCALLGLFAHLLTATASRWKYTQDSDLAPWRPHRHLQVDVNLPPDSIQINPNGSALTVQVIRLDHGKPMPVSDLQISFDGLGSEAITDFRGIARVSPGASCAPGRAQTQAAAMLANRYFSVSGNGNQPPYRIVATLPCSGQVTLFFKSDSTGGQALGIWQVASKAAHKLEQAIGLGFWSSPLEFIWPADADYYSSGQVHITRGDYWDVVGHEMGHGIYDLGKLGQFGGGEHKIDECYDPTLALSEGWASFFSGWVSVDPNDPDAKFEYMVPRRAPIRFENLPENVCKGEANEWRVTGFFWDLLDLHEDGETAHQTFAQLWASMAGTEVGSASEAAARMKNSGLDPTLLQRVWRLNFQTPP